MRVAICSHNARQKDAIGEQVARRLEYFAAGGHEVRLFVEDSGLLHPSAAPLATRHDPESLWRHEVDRQYLESADLVLAVYGHWYPLLELLPALADRKPRLVLDYYGVTPARLAGRQERGRLREAERGRGLVWCMDAVITLSTFAAQELHEATGYPRDRIHVLPCVPPAGLAPMRPSPASRGSSSLFTLLFVGRLAGNKRPTWLIEAAARLQDLSRPVAAVLIGDDRDIYADEARRCRDLARRLGIEERVHILGQVASHVLADWYDRADVLVIPSLHEGFCLPVIEAMGRGLPVVAARAAALPETVASAGLTFDPDSMDDLVRKVRLILEPPAAPPRLPGGPIAIVAPRFGPGFAGGAETSLGIIARSFHAAGRRVEVFTTCNRHDSCWDNHVPTGTEVLDGLTVHRHPVDAHDRERFLSALEAIRRKEDEAPPSAVRDYLENSLRSRSLVQALARRRDEFAAVLAGPYLLGLTVDVAQLLGPQCLLLPCFHDEPMARLAAIQEAHRQAGGLLFHTPEEQHFAEAVLGINHPNGRLLGTLLAASTGDPSRGRRRCGDHYLVYCGRYSVEKGVDRLLAHAARYTARRPHRFRFVFLGQGGMAIPRSDWTLDLGFVDEATKQDVIAGARALVQLSRNESLSLVALEAWAAGVPVLADRACAALRGQIERSGGGRTISSNDEFDQALDELWQDPKGWARAGAAGQRYVRAEYQSPERFQSRLEAAVGGLAAPLAALMREQGTERAETFTDPRWRDRFQAILDRLLSAPREPARRILEIAVPLERRLVSPGADRLLVPVRIRNRGNRPAVPFGPAGVAITSGSQVAARLPGILIPGQSGVVFASVKTAPGLGRQTLRLDVEGEGWTTEGSCSMEWEVREPDAGTAGLAEEFTAAAQKALAEAQAIKTLPDDYEDVTQGAFASLKRKIKRKLLNNFRKRYVDVLSRQQSEFNAQVLAAIAQLADGCSILGQGAPFREDLDRLAARQRTLLKRLRRLERELRRITS